MGLKLAVCLRAKRIGESQFESQLEFEIEIESMMAEHRCTRMILTALEPPPASSL